MAEFVNPAYATPAQRAAMRKYAEQLMTPSDVRHWTQGVGDIARALVGGTMLSRAGEQERGAKTEYARQLAEAVRSKDPAQIQSVLANPEVEPVQAFILKQLLEAKPSTRVSAGGASYEEPSPSIIESQGGGGVPLPRPAPGAGTGVGAQNVPLAPGGGNLSNQLITGVKVEDLPPIPNQRVADGFAPIPGVPSRVTKKLTGLSDLSTQFKTQQDQYDLANKENMAVAAKRPVAEERMANIKLLKQISDHINDPAMVAKLRSRAADLGIPLGPNADQYEIFSSVTKRLTLQELQEAVQGARLPPAAMQDYSAANAQLWNTPEARNHILNTLARPLDHDIRRSKYVNSRIGKQDPVSLWQKQTSIPVVPNALDLPTPTPESISALKSGKGSRAEFDKYYGPNASDEYLGAQ